MAIYKVTYRISGETTYRDVNIESDHPLEHFDDKVLTAARRDSANHLPPTQGTSVFGITIVTVTEVI